VSQSARFFDFSHIERAFNRMDRQGRQTNMAIPKALQKRTSFRWNCGPGALRIGALLIPAAQFALTA
jgi:hypothetical protein